MLTEFRVLHEDDPIESVSQGPATPQRSFPVLDGKGPTGFLLYRDVADALARADHRARVGDLMRRDVLVVEDGDPLDRVIDQMQSRATPLAIVEQQRRAGRIIIAGTDRPMGDAPFVGCRKQRSGSRRERLGSELRPPGAVTRPPPAPVQSVSELWMNILVVDVGERTSRFSPRYKKTRREFDSGPTMTPTEMVAGVLKTWRAGITTSFPWVIRAPCCGGSPFPSRTIWAPAGWGSILKPHSSIP